MTQIPIQIAVEDDLSEILVRVLLVQVNRNFLVGQCYKKGGSSFLRQRIDAFNSAASAMPYLVLTDLDTWECPPVLKQEWLKYRPEHANLLFRVAVREVESWVIADKEGFAQFVGLAPSDIVDRPEELEDPKEYIFDLVRRAKNRELIADILPRKGSTARIGPNYSFRMCQFVQQKWRMGRASSRASSLRRAAAALRAFSPEWLQ